MTPLPVTGEPTEELAAIVSKRANQRYLDHQRLIRIRADRTFAWLMAIQWCAEIAAALWISPLTWIGETSQIHIHVYGSIFIGGALALPVIYLAWKQPGAALNQYVVGIAQTLTAALLIHVTGGRAETHFYVFVSLAFIALYRDFRVLILPTIVVALDHFIRGVYWPESVFGAASPGNWRWLEHTGWVSFEVVVLAVACVQAQREMRLLARQWAYLSATKDLVDDEVRRQMSELASSERRLRVSELRIRKIIDTAYDAFVVTNTDGKILEWSVRAESLFGWTPFEVLGKNILHVLGVSELTSQLTEAVATSMIRMQSGARLETTAFHRDGMPMAIEASISAMIFNHKITLNIFFHDISARKAMQTQLLHAKKMQGIGQLAAGIAHEINTPTQYANDNMRFLLDSFHEIDRVLSSVENLRARTPAFVWQAYDDLAKTTDLEYLRSEIPLAIEQAIDGVHRIAEITMAMKEFSHPGTRVKEVVDPRRIIQSSATVCRNEWKYVAELRTEFDPELVAIPCLPSELSQVLVILIVNAAQAISESRKTAPDRLGTILIQTKRFEEWGEISVQDDGPGIPPENLDRIFEPFFTTKEVGKGTGQGLAIAHSVVVEKHGGSVSVVSRVGKGTTFTVRLPLEKQCYAEHSSDAIQLVHS